MRSAFQVETLHTEVPGIENEQGSVGRNRRRKRDVELPGTRAARPEAEELLSIRPVRDDLVIVPFEAASIDDEDLLPDERAAGVQAGLPELPGGAVALLDRADRHPLGPARRLGS